jgi:hypothetical protein
MVMKHVMAWALARVHQEFVVMESHVQQIVVMKELISVFMQTHASQVVMVHQVILLQEHV